MWNWGFIHGFPYTNFHDLNLDWFLEQFQNFLARFSEIEEEWDKYKKYIDDYFDNLDVQEQIDNKINEMIEDGTFTDLLTPIIAEYNNPIFVESTSAMTDHGKTYVLTTNGHIYTWNDLSESFADTGLIYGNSNNVLIYRGAVRSGTNLINDILAPGIYTLATSDIAGGLPNDFTAANAWLVVFYSSALKHYMLTESSGVRNTWIGSGTVWNRLAAYVETDNKINSLSNRTLQYRGAVPANTDFNNDTLLPGIYTLDASTITGGLPSDFNASNAWLTVFYSGSLKYYMLSESSGLRTTWIRTGTVWNRLASYSEISTTNTSLSELSNKALQYRGAIPVGTDLINDTFLPGIYTVESSRITAGLPSDYTAANGWLVIFYSSTLKHYMLTESSGKRITWIGTGTTWYRCANILRNMRISVIGDSITEKNYRANTNWVNLFSSVGAIMQNLGQSGTGFAETYQNGTNYATRINRIDNPDLIGVSTSFNDMRTIATLGLGTPDSTDTTLMGYVNNFFTALLEKFPTTPIICYTTNPWRSYHYGANTNSDNYIDYIEQICKRHGIPFLNLYKDGCSLRPWMEANNQYYFDSDGTREADGVHPNSKGHELLFRHYLPFFMDNVRSPIDLY